jgi:hypothetical protein
MGMDSYLRRSLQLLAWIESQKPEARVGCGAREWGTWQELMPRWRLEGHRICMQFLRADQPVTCRAKCVLPAPWGARIPLFAERDGELELFVCWEKSERSARTSGARLQAVLGWIRSRWPGCRICTITRRSDLAHSLSNRYWRLRIHWQERDLLVLACAREEWDDEVPSILTQGLLWMSCLADKRPFACPPSVHLLVPAAHTALLCHRYRMLDPTRIQVSIWECEMQDSGGIRVCRPGMIAAPVEDRDYRWPVLGPFRWSPMLMRVLDLAPEIIQRYPRFQDYDSLRICGLEFARALGAGRDRMIYGVGGRQSELTDENFEDLRRLVNEILYYRRADSPSSEHPYYRMQAERWLESMLLSDISELFPELIPGSIYPQIPVYLGKTPGRADILGSDRSGNLVVMELKVTEDPELPLQALDYWGRVRAHNANGDFERRGYFAGIRLTREPPRLYLLAPIFRFHDACERLPRYLDPNVEVIKIGINEDWRCGVKVLRRSRISCGEVT